MRHVAIVGALAMLLVAVPAVGQDAVLYELTENMQLRGGDSRRVATAALAGSVRAGTSICPESLAASLALSACRIHAEATDAVDVVTAVGPVRATFVIVVPGDNVVDGPELVIVRGSLSGTVDLSPTLDLSPVGTVSGTWSADGLADGPMAGLSTGGIFNGTFRLPFSDGGSAMYLVVPETGETQPVRADEMSLGIPTVRLELMLH